MVMYAKRAHQEYESQMTFLFLEELVLLIVITCTRLFILTDAFLVLPKTTTN